MTDFVPELNKTIINKYKKELSYFLSNHDFDKFIAGASQKVFKYADLENQIRFEDILPEKLDYAIILIESKKNSGHWVCLLRNNNQFEYFGSYGLSHQEALNFAPQAMNKYLGNEMKDRVE